jgi:hypothetical protein
VKHDGAGCEQDDVYGAAQILDGDTLRQSCADHAAKPMGEWLLHDQAKSVRKANRAAKVRQKRAKIPVITLPRTWGVARVASRLR